MRRSAHPYHRRKSNRRRVRQKDVPVPPSVSAANSVPTEIAVTDHALLRYLERFEGVDIAAAGERLRRRLCSGERISKAIEFAGTAPHRIRVNGATFCLCNGRVVTCYP